MANNTDSSCLNDCVDEYFDTLESLPLNVIRNLNLIRDLDNRCQQLVVTIGELSQQYMESAETMGADEKRRRLAEIGELFATALAFSDDKCEVANQSWHHVDRHIAQLDAQLKTLEQRVGASADAPNGVESDSNRRKRRSVRNNRFNSDHFVYTDYGPDRDQQLLAIDPNEPVYCLCRQVSFGQMVRCDAKDCDFEWFHFDCVRIRRKPKGKWFCQKCRHKSN